MVKINLGIISGIKISHFKEKWLNYCETINDLDIKRVVLNTFSSIPDYFWTIPSSSSGKYHPSDEISTCGLVKHTLKDCKVCDEMQSMLPLSSRDRDLCIAALLLHDCCKSGMENIGHTVHEHPFLAAELIRNSNENSDVSCEVANLVESHMGRWNISKNSNVILPTPLSELQKFVHLCDMFASRKAWKISIKGGK